MTLHIKPLVETNFKLIATIAENCFGEGYLSYEQFIKYLNKPYLAFTLLNNNQLIGFCLIDEATSNYDEAFVTLLDKKSMVIKTIAIKETEQGKGYGSFLLRFCIRYLMGIDKKSIYYPEWNEYNRNHFSKRLSTMGFKNIKKFNHYWKDDSLIKNYNCIRCGNPPCLCSLNLLKLQL